MNIIQSGNISALTGATSINPKLSVGTYDVQFNRQTAQYELHHRPGFKLPDKVYGGQDNFSDRCLKTFKELGKGMAVLASGPKGCGKTLTAKKLGMDSGMPVLCLIEPMAGAQFTAFLTDIPNPCVIFIDEFEKLYKDVDDRNSFLTLLDGASDNKHLFVLTSNDPDIGEFFANRPGRVRYHRQYDEFDQSILMEMIADKMKKGRIRTAVEKFIERVGSVSPDVLTSLISECQIHNEPPEKFMDFFNISTELGGTYDVTIKIQGYRLKKNVPPDKVEEAVNFKDEERSSDLETARYYHSEGEAWCDKVDETWTSTFCRPFRTRNQKRNGRDGGIEVDINYAKQSGGRDTNYRNFEFMQHQIKKMSREHGQIFIELHDGRSFHFTKTAGGRQAF